jgi:hypothetical protein
MSEDEGLDDPKSIDTLRCFSLLLELPNVHRQAVGQFIFSHKISLWQKIKKVIIHRPLNLQK